MKKRWKDPVKDVPPQPETLAIMGDFGKFTADMKKLFRADKAKQEKPTSSSPVPASS